MIKQILTLIFMISYLYSCNSNTGNSKAIEENLSVNQADGIAIQETVIEEPYINDYSDPNMDVSHYRNPKKFSTDEFKKITDFFYKNHGEQLIFEIAQLLNENELSEEKFEFEMPLYASEIYTSENGALLFIRMFTGVGNRLTVLSIHNDMVVSKIDGVTLDADSDGNYYLSSKYKISGLGQIEIDVTEEDTYL